MTEDLTVFFSDFAVPVVWIDGMTTRSTVGILDMPDEIRADGLALSTEYVLSFETSKLPGISQGKTITVDGASYKVRTVRKIDDGKVSLLELAKV